MTERDTKYQIEEQIKALKMATDKATKSKEAANEYLIEAGIITQEKEAKFEETEHT